MQKLAEMKSWAISNFPQKSMLHKWVSEQSYALYQLFSTDQLLENQLSPITVTYFKSYAEKTLELCSLLPTLVGQSWSKLVQCKVLYKTQLPLFLTLTGTWRVIVLKISDEKVGTLRVRYNPGTKFATLASAWGQYFQILWNTCEMCQIIVLFFFFFLQ